MRILQGHSDWVTAVAINCPAQKRVFDTFHFALKSGGLLFLGTSESLQDPKDKRSIRADEKLLAVFDGKKVVSMFEMTKYSRSELR